jgi:hypothetical protein
VKNYELFCRPSFDFSRRFIFPTVALALPVVEPFCIPSKRQRAGALLDAPRSPGVRFRAPASRSAAALRRFFIRAAGLNAISCRRESKPAGSGGQKGGKTAKTGQKPAFPAQKTQKPSQLDEKLPQVARKLRLVTRKLSQLLTELS